MAGLADVIADALAHRRISLEGLQGDELGLATALAEACATQARLGRDLLFLEQVFDAIPVMVFVKEATDLRFVRFNRAGVRLLGYEAGELLGKNDFDFFPKEQAEFFTSNDRRVLAGTTVVEIPEEPILTRYQGLRILRTHKIPVHDATGAPLWLVGISEDITERRNVDEELMRRASQLRVANLELQRSEIELRASLHRMRALARQYPGAIWTTDRRLVVTSVAGARMAGVGLHARESLGREVGSLPIGSTPAALAAHQGAVNDVPGSYVLELLGRRYEVATEVYLDGGEAGVIGVALDTTPTG